MNAVDATVKEGNLQLTLSRSLSLRYNNLGGNTWPCSGIKLAKTEFKQVGSHKLLRNGAIQLTVPKFLSNQVSNPLKVPLVLKTKMPHKRLQELEAHIIKPLKIVFINLFFTIKKIFKESLKTMVYALCNQTNKTG